MAHSIALADETGLADLWEEIKSKIKGKPPPIFKKSQPIVLQLAAHMTSSLK